MKTISILVLKTPLQNVYLKNYLNLSHQSFVSLKTKQKL